MSPVVIIGAGPYGLSLAAHLHAAGVPFRIFGSPMYNWRHHMPQGMLLKSEGFATNLYDRESQFTLEAYCAREGIPYAHRGLPVSLETFISYGLEFQRRFVPDLEERRVLAIEPLAQGFLLTCDDGSTCAAGRVVVATGISHFHDIPKALSGLPEEFVSHSSKHASLAHFKGRDVTIIGGGSSAVDVAASLLECGATPRLVARAPKIHFLNPPATAPQSWLQKIRTPSSGLGPGWRSRLCTDAPLLFRMMPERFRLRVVRTHLGPSAGSYVRDKVVGNVAILGGTRLKSARVSGNKVHLRLVKDVGTEMDLETDHIIAATGYKVDLRRLPYLNERVLSAIRSVDHTPILSSNFESSISGLYFVGLASANTFGPMLRFAYGAGFASRRLSRHLRKLGRADAGRPDRAFAFHPEANTNLG
jgi:hypothetical protein